MEYRSSNASGFVHFGGDVVSNVNSSHGVRLSGGSTGGVVETVGDDTSASLLIRAKGAGGITIGNSSQAVTIAGSGFSVGTSTAVMKGIYAKTSTWSNAAISSGAVAELTFASTTFDVSLGDLAMVAFTDALAAPIACGGFRLSTVDASRITVLLTAPGSTASSTLSGSILVSWVDLT